MKKSYVIFLCVVFFGLGYAISNLGIPQVFLGEKYEITGNGINIHLDSYEMPDGRIDIYGIPDGTFADGSPKIMSRMIHQVSNIERWVNKIEKVNSEKKPFKISFRIYSRGNIIERLRITEISH